MHLFSSDTLAFNAWVHSLHLSMADKEILSSRKTFVTVNQISAANKLLSRKFSIQNGLKDTHALLSNISGILTLAQCNTCRNKSNCWPLIDAAELPIYYACHYRCMQACAQIFCTCEIDELAKKKKLVRQ